MDDEELQAVQERHSIGLVVVVDGNASGAPPSSISGFFALPRPVVHFFSVGAHTGATVRVLSENPARGRVSAQHTGPGDEAGLCGFRRYVAPGCGCRRNGV